MRRQLDEWWSGRLRVVLFLAFALAFAFLSWVRPEVARALDHGAPSAGAPAGEGEPAVPAVPMQDDDAGYPAPDSATAVPGAYGPEEDGRPAQARPPAPPRDTSAPAMLPSRHDPERPSHVDADPSERASTGTFQLALGLSYIAAPLLFVATASPLEEASLLWLAAPAAMHLAYDDPGGGVIALIGYPGTIVGAGALGVAIETAQCSGQFLCGLAGAVVGGLIGAVSWSLIDVFAIAPATRGEVARTRRRSALALGGGPVPGGGLALSVAGRL